MLTAGSDEMRRTCTNLSLSQRQTYQALIHESISGISGARDCQGRQWALKGHYWPRNEKSRNNWNNSNECKVWARRFAHFPSPYETHPKCTYRKRAQRIHRHAEEMHVKLTNLLSSNNKRMQKPCRTKTLNPKPCNPRLQSTKTLSNYGRQNLCKKAAQFAKTQIP